LVVPDTLTITDVNVSVRLNHTFDGDLRIDLVHPDGVTIVNLVNRRGSSGANFGSGTNNCAGTPTVFDDQAATLITAGAPPYVGTFKPEGSLAALNGKTTNGTWKLRVNDNANGDTGIVGCVKLEFNKRYVCCGALINAAPPATLVSENFVPANNVPDPNETVTMNFPLNNLGANNTTNLVATLQATGGVTNPSGPQNYGVVVANGPAVSRPFTFTVGNISCGTPITATLQLQDGATNLGTITYTIATGVVGSAVSFTENFDAVTAPALPAGWTTAHTGTPTANFVTSTTIPASAPNDAFAPNNTVVSSIDLVSPTIPAASQVTFQNLYNLEASTITLTNTFDGMVLDISINGGPFADIITAGGSFVAGGYNKTVVASSNPLNTRSAWGGLSGGTTAAPTYITTTVNLPPAASSQSFVLRWRVGTDSSVAAAGSSGVRIDSIVVSSPTYTCSTTPGGPAGLQYYPLSRPLRILDTRTGQTACDTPGVPLTAAVSRTQLARRTCDSLTIPATAQAIVGNATVVNNTGAGDGFVTLYPSGTTRPNVSNLNYVTGQTVPNAFTVGLDAGTGSFDIYAQTGVNFIVDVTGYYAPPATGLYYHPLPHPVRILDTRPGQTACDTPGTPIAGNTSRTEAARITCDGVTIPAAAQAIVGNATLINDMAGGSGFVTLYPSGATQPNSSNLNYVPGQIVPNAFTVGLGAGDGAFNIYALTTLHFVVDVTGYYSNVAAADSNGVAGLSYYQLSS
ncbi:MAG: proprotein convertase P-domain-containing protein, partial [Pyrinomonadaceae bacterium]